MDEPENRVSNVTSESGTEIQLNAKAVEAAQEEKAPLRCLSFAECFNLKLQGERIRKALARENSENSHEAKRVYEKDRAWRSERRKKELREEHAKRVAMGDLLRPLGVQPSRKERREKELRGRKYLKKYLRQQARGAFGVPSSPAPSENSTESSPAP